MRTHAQEVAVFLESGEPEGGREGGREGEDEEGEWEGGREGGREGGMKGGRDVPLHGFLGHRLAPEEGDLTLAEDGVGGEAEGGREGG